MSDELIGDIKTVALINQELILRINQIGDETTQFTNYYIQARPEPSPEKGFFFIEQVVEELPRSSLLENWKKSITLKKPIDLFNDKINFNCTNFQDITRLNESMLGVIDKFLFLDPKRAQSELVKYKSNFETLQQCLGEIEGALNNVTNFYESKLKAYQSEVDDINTRLNGVFLNPDVIFGPKFGWEGSNYSHTVVKNKAALNSGKSGCILSNRGFSTGIHKFTIKILSRSSTCMIGVAPNSVSRNNYNYTSNGFFMNLANGTLYSGPPQYYSYRTCIGRSFDANSTITLILNCNNHTLTYQDNGVDYLAYENLPSSVLYLALDNDGAGASEVELTKKS